MFLFLFKEVFIMYDVYRSLKEKYPKSIILIKSGGFYECLCDDCIIINKLLGYKIRRWNKYIRCGFPVASLVKVKSILTKCEVNYIIYDKDNTKVIRFNHNHYNDYIIDYNYNTIINRIDNITKYLNDNIFNSNINKILTNIEGLICKISL